MKYILTLTLCLLAFTAQAQTAQQMEMMKKYQNMSPEQMQAEAMKMQKHAMGAVECFKNVDQGKMDELQARGKAIQHKVKALCAEGDEAAAEQYAMTEGMKLQSDPTVKKLKDCSGDIAKQFDFTPPMVAGERKSICE